MDANHQDKANNNLGTTENKIWLPPSYISNKAPINNGQISTLQRPTTDDPDVWKAYWKTQGWPWRTEPEINAERQKYLAERRSITPNIEQGIYPFGGINLSRADVEWLLATHENGRGPVNWQDESQRERHGLDLRGAKLSHENLSKLPMANMQGGIAWHNNSLATPQLRETAAVYLKKANLIEIHLEGSDLSYAYLEEADLDDANLENATLYDAHLTNAKITEAYAANADFAGAHLERADLNGANLKAANFGGAHLEYAFAMYAKLEKADLSQAFLNEAQLAKAHLERAILFDAHLERADFTGAHLEGADFSHTHLEQANLSSAHLEGVNFMNAHLDGASLEGSFLDSATQLYGISLGNNLHGYVSLADTHWGDANLSILKWATIPIIGDEPTVRNSKRHDRESKDKSWGINVYQIAERANRQLAVALQNQGLIEDAAHFAYRAQLCQRVVLRRQKKFGSYLFSIFLDFLAGYGYHPLRTLFWYFLTICTFTLAYHYVWATYNLEKITHHPLSYVGAVVFSVTAFHGRGFFLGGDFGYDSFITILAALEAVIGLIIEFSFIATFTQRFFGR